MWITTQVVMLPTDKRSILTIAKHYNNRLRHIGSDYKCSPENEQYQHLYFVTDDEIKEGDWFVYLFNDEWILRQASKENWRGIRKKIVATTNPDLWYHDFKRPEKLDYNTTDFKPSIAKIGKDFIQEYVAGQGAIKQVMLQYDLVTPKDMIVCNESIAEVYAFNHEGDYDELYNEKLKELGGPQRVPQLDLRPNGTVRIKPVNIEDMTNKQIYNSILEIIKEESELSNVRQYTCINGLGYSQFERNIADRVLKLIKNK